MRALETKGAKVNAMDAMKAEVECGSGLGMKRELDAKLSMSDYT